MNITKWVMTGMTAAILCGCASDGSSSEVQVSSPSATAYPAVPITACRVSSYPPKGTYTVIAQLKATGQVGENPTQLLTRLQKQGAAMGATYVMVTSVTDKKFINPTNSEVLDNPYLSQENSFFNTASPDTVTYNHELGGANLGHNAGRHRRGPPDHLGQQQAEQGRALQPLADAPPVIANRIYQIQIIPK